MEINRHGTEVITQTWIYRIVVPRFINNATTHTMEVSLKNRFLRSAMQGIAAVEMTG